MLKKKVSVVVAAAVLGCSIFGAGVSEVDAANFGVSYSISSFFKKIKDKVNNAKQEETTTEAETTQQETTAQEETTVPETTEELTTEDKTEDKTTSTEGTEKESASTEDAENGEAATTETTDTETATGETTATESTAQKEIVTEEETTSNQESLNNANIYNSISYYQEMAGGEAEWLWSQQMSNGAFAFYNAENGSVYINPYFSEIVAIALIGYDSSETARAKIEDYFDWHFAHINTAEQDYNGLAGTIYDYDVVVQNGVVVSETSKGSYDSTDSYSALFIKALADYAKTYGDKSYLQAHESLIKDITNVMFATMSGGYTYAKPDYQIRYLMDNAEVYAGLCAAKYIYGNVIDDKEMYEKVSNAVAYYDEHFNEHWWKGDHYAAVLNSDNSEYTGYAFSWDMLYPCAAAQIFPILYGVIDADSVYAQTVYEGFCNAWDWQDMDYVSEGVTVFCWGNFAYLGGLMDDEEKLNAYMEKYDDIVDSGRPYPLYSSESAMVLMGCDEMIRQLENKIVR